jgi:glycosyltransferase involved in cell wall biosynthesis
VAASGLFLEHPQTGTGRYARHVLKYLLGEADMDASVIAGDRALAAQALDLDTAGNYRRVVRAPIPPILSASYARKLYWEASLRLRAQVLYSPHFSTPVVSSCPTVISIHDVIPLTDPAYSRSPSAKGYFWLVGLAARRAAAAITLSRYARQEIVQRLRVPEARVHVVVPGVEAAFGPEADPVASARARDAYRLPQRYLLYVGGADARKNIGVLLEALAGLGDASCVPTLIVAAGLPKPGQEAVFPDWRAQALRLQLGARVQFVERIAEQDLPAVYRGAEAFLFPSRAEGFGLSPLEAMASGTPVICSDATSLPEAVGEAGILIDPDRPHDWASAMQRVVADGDLRTRLSVQGIARAARFRWSDTGERVAEVIRGAVQCAS